MIFALMCRFKNSQVVAISFQLFYYESAGLGHSSYKDLPGEVSFRPCGLRV